MGGRSIATSNRNLVLFVTVAVVLGLGFVAVKVGLAFVPPLLFATFRIAIAAGILLAFTVWTVDDWRPRTRRDALGILAGGLFFVFGGNVFYFLGLERTTSGVFAIVLSFDPVLTVALGALLLADERISRVGLLGVLVALVGVGIIVQPDPSHFLSGNLRGEEYALLCATSIAVGTVLQRWSNHEIEPTALTAWSMVVAAPAMLLVSLASGESFASIDPTVAALAAIGFIAVISTAIGYTLYFNLIEDVGAIRASLVQYAVPVVASIAGWLVLGERLPPEALVGYLVIFVGFLLLNVDGVRSVIGRLQPTGGQG